MVPQFIKLLLSFFGAGVKRSQFKGYRNFHFTAATKVSVLHDQILLFFEEEIPEVKSNTEAYINQIIEGLKKDFARDAGKLHILDDIFFELKVDHPNRKKVISMLAKL
ncbi:MAG: hypothetical protein IPK62_11130 [Bacteroidetes bacterium]|nr:hypothetical protein [Bacteroidota bacterium]MBP6315253.1 hypothetical protein [Chitinophagaceae bacterium]